MYVCMYVSYESHITNQPLSPLTLSHSRMLLAWLLFLPHSSYLEKAESIDPNYCDINYQFAHCHVQQGKYLEFEKRLTNALLCPFTMGQAIPLWQNYWKQVTSDPRSGAEAKERMDKYQAIINEAVEKEQEKEEKQQRKKHQAYGGEEL